MENTIVNQNAAAEQPSVLDLLLGEKVINVAKNLPTAKFEVPRLSEAAGAPVIFTLQALPYGRVQDISRLDQDAELQILLAGCSTNLAGSRRRRRSRRCCCPAKSPI